MDETLRLLGGVLLLIGLLAGIVGGWLAFARLHRWRREQADRLPALHAEIVGLRQQWLETAYAVDAKVQTAAGRLETGGRDFAVFLIAQGFSKLTGQRAGFWGQALARVLIGRLSPAVSGGSPRGGLPV